MIAQNEVERPATYEGIVVQFRFGARPVGTFAVTRASYTPTQWNHYAAGNPIRVQPATGSHLASIRSAVNGVGGNPGLSAALAGASSGLLGEVEIEDAGSVLAPGDSAGILDYKNASAALFADTRRRRGAQLVARGRLLMQALQEARGAMTPASGPQRR